MPAVTGFSPEYMQICDQIHKATDKFFTDDGTLIRSIITVRPENMPHLAQCYKATYGQDLVEVISKGTSGDFKNLMEHVVKGSFVTDAEALRAAVKGLT